MTEHNDETHKRMASLEESNAWLKDRIWFGVGNLHDRVHTLEDRSTDRSFELDKMKGDIKSIKEVIGLDGYGGRNLINDLRDALDTIEGLKEGIISVKDFQTLMRDVDELKQRGKAQISFMNFIQFGIVGAVISFIMQIVMSRLVGP